MSRGSPGTAARGRPAARLQEVEERLALLARLERKHGGSIAEVLAHAERCRRRYEELTGAESDLEAVQDGTVGRHRRARRARRAADPRSHQGGSTARARGARAAGGAGDGRRAVRDRDRATGGRLWAAWRGRDRDGDRPQRRRQPLAPLREAASGGELSRVMLALLSVAHGSAQGSDPAARGMLVFDEIDAGIGGHTARAVGEHLRALAVGRQVLCITHLPQVAALGERHFTIVKDTRARPARTTVTALEGDAVVAELVRMMGAADEDTGAADHARELSESDVVSALVGRACLGATRRLRAMGRTRARPTRALTPPSRRSGSALASSALSWGDDGRGGGSVSSRRRARGCIRRCLGARPRSG